MQKPSSPSFDRRQIWIVATIVCCCLLTLLITPFVGITFFGISDVLPLFQPGSVQTLNASIFISMRVPRVLLAFFAGAGLALSGLVYQTLFRNPLATPYTLGISGGASLGAALCVISGVNFVIAGFDAQTIFAFSGAMVAIAIVYSIARFNKSFSVMTLLLAGVALNFFFSSIILFIQYIGNFTDSIRIMRWLMGGVETVGYQSLTTLIPVTLVSTLVILCLTRELNLLSIGEDIAATRGASVSRLKITLFLVTSLQIGTTVALCGPIGFIGMMAPHIARILVGPDHKVLSYTSLLIGGSFLVLCDTLARTLIAPAEMPVGIITALLGGPFFLWLLLSGRARQH